MVRPAQPRASPARRGSVQKEPAGGEAERIPEDRVARPRRRGDPAAGRGIGAAGNWLSAAATRMARNGATGVM